MRPGYRGFKSHPGDLVPVGAAREFAFLISPQVRQTLLPQPPAVGTTAVPPLADKLPMSRPDVPQILNAMASRPEGVCPCAAGSRRVPWGPQHRKAGRLVLHPRAGWPWARPSVSEGQFCEMRRVGRVISWCGLGRGCPAGVTPSAQTSPKISCDKRGSLLKGVWEPCP